MPIHMLAHKRGYIALSDMVELSSGEVLGGCLGRQLAGRGDEGACRGLEGQGWEGGGVGETGGGGRRTTVFGASGVEAETGD